MKKIGVLVHALTVEYALEVLNGIFSYFKDKQDVQFFVAQTKDPRTDSGNYEYQSWNSLSLLFATDIDLVIVITGSYSSTISTDHLGKILKLYKEKPIISVGADLETIVLGATFSSDEVETALKSISFPRRPSNAPFIT